MATAVWVYKKLGEEEGSIELSIASALKHLEGVDKFIVFGDDPGIGKALWVPCPTITRAKYKELYGGKFKNKWRKWIDSVHKLKTIIDCPFVDEEFIWLYDDTFFIQPTHVSEFSVPLFNGTLGNKLAKKHKNNSWRQCRLRSSNHLSQEGLPTLDFSTHAPLVFEKKKLQKTIDRFECISRPRVIESMYGNHHFGDTAKRSRNHKTLFRYITRFGQVPNSKCVNVGNGYFRRYEANIRSIVTA